MWSIFCCTEKGPSIESETMKVVFSVLLNCAENLPHSNQCLPHCIDSHYNENRICLFFILHTIKKAKQTIYEGQFVCGQFATYNRPIILPYTKVHYLAVSYNCLQLQLLPYNCPISFPLTEWFSRQLLLM